MMKRLADIPAAFFRFPPPVQRMSELWRPKNKSLSPLFGPKQTSGFASHMSGFECKSGHALWAGLGRVAARRQFHTVL